MPTTTDVARVDTRQITGRRKVRYAHLEELLADAERLQAGGYTRLGNWSLGQIAKHVAAGMNVALDGSPVKAPFLLRFVASRFFKKGALKQMKPGFKLPKKFAARLVPPETGDSEGLDQLRASIRRWQAEPQRHPQPFFGPLSDEEWDQLTLRHAELHMSFLLPK
jgi:hypothetical protein